jgi:tetratricopeptide (TPR) repeat protein
MSPEQAEVNNQDIDTRSDIYALGVLLYELLTGTTPLTRHRAEEVALMEVLRVIREEEPPRPSTRLSESRESLPSISARRQTEPAKLTKLLRGELDWIVMKALEKDRNRRYESANGFALDLQRYLADEPVQACPPSPWYRFRKFTRRNRSALTVAGLVLFVIALIGGGGGWVLRDRAVRQARAANDQELALKSAELYQGQGKRAESLAAVSRAELLAGQAPPDPGRAERLAAVKERLAAEARDQEFVARFEDIRLRTTSQVNLTENQFNEDAAYPEIREALRQYGLAIGVMAPAQAAGYIRGRPEPVRRDLVAALDECLEWAPKGEGQTRTWLLATLEAADTEAWRVRVREALAARDWQALEPMARAVDVRTQPPSFLIVVTRKLPLPAQGGATRLELLRRAQGAYPADLWANIQLALELVRNGQPAEAVRYWTAALALRPDNPGIYHNLGHDLRAAGEVDAAIAAYRHSLALAPQYYSAHVGLGNALHSQGRLDEAIVEFRAAIRTNKDDPLAHYNLGNALRDQGRLDEAIAEFRAAIATKQNLPEAHFNLGMALQARGRLDEAIAEFRAAIRLRDRPGDHLNLGNALQAQGRLDEAIAEYRAAIATKQDFPETYNAHHGLGNALLAQGRLDEAIAAFREAVRLKQDFPEVHVNLGNALRAQGRLDEAIAEYRAAIATKLDFPEAYKAHVNLGLALRDQGRLDEAIAESRKAIATKQNYPEAHFNLGNALRAQGRRDEAIAEFRAAIASKLDFPEAYKAHFNLGNALRDQGRLDEAVAAFREAIRLKQDFPEVHHNLGNALRAQGRLDDAIAEFRAAIRLKQDHPLAHVNLGNALLDTGQRDEAIAEYRAAIRINKDDPVAHYNLGNALRDQGRLDDAIDEYREAIRLRKDYADDHVGLGNALGAQGRLDEAIAEFRAAIRLRKDHAGAHANLGAALQQQGKFREALEELRRGHELGSRSPSWRFPSAEWVRQCERRVELDAKLPRVLKGEAQPADAAERLELAQMCGLPGKSLNAAAVRFYTDVFTAEPKVANDLGAGHRYNAACVAALAGVGQGQDARDLDDKGRARLRQQALDWLRADLAACGRVVDSGPEQTRTLALGRLQHCLADPDFAGVREPRALARLPESERQAWQQLWADVRDRLARARGPATPKREPATK